ncbi:DNA-directed RNA polymerase subunit beta [bacterium (Candidatus Gribaldobacteria) CG08_land_8_20_14_0_20_39_15]|uniref:DNA-directed RNA polymerase subunit beta n=1 Tax=bacterium (Candidatus Gribaldobacteria) CG08_land_8_20_14_0_20_39_15 TaxID=2014273 RepID=A0A2M6XVC8_9BACT|nr:MAG: DNA-directed RNA polymerase subunit beta [bacterium (Candidatus Gribaldobacteria) CG08_land_8_20_14_0_20_39_15]
MKVKDFSKSRLSFPLPYLLQLQKDGWGQLWERDIRELFQEMFPVRDYTGKQFELNFVDFYLGKPKYQDGYKAKEEEDSYTAPLRIKFALKNLKTKEIKEQEVFLVDFPLMMDNGVFIINGVERVVIPQLIRSSGVFFTLKNFKGKRYFGAKMIPSRGAWLEFSTDTSGFLGVKVNRQRKAAATTLLRVFGLEDSKDIKSQFQDIDKGEIRYLEKTLSRDPSKNANEAVVEIYHKLRPGDLVTPDAARELVWNMFCNFQRYDLSKVGRWKIWERLPQLNPENKTEINKDDRVLNQADILETIKEIIRLNNNPDSHPDQIDHLGNRRIKNFSELCVARVRVGLMRMERIIKDRMSTLDAATLTPSQLINSRPVMAVVHEFFAASQFSQFMDAENPLAELEHKRRLTATGPGGLTRERAGFEVRDVQPSHYGRICPIQTPEGQNVGLINHLATFASVNSFGFLQTPYFEIKQGRVSERIRYLTAPQEEHHFIANSDIEVDDKGNIIDVEVESRRRGDPVVMSKKKIDFMDISPNQPLSVATSLIPFLQNDDANRALMGSNMQRQAVPLLKPEAPLVGTGMEEKVAYDSGEVILAPADGEIKEVDASEIKLKTKDNKILSFNLHNFKRRNQYTVTHQKPVVKKGAQVKKGDILTDGTAIDQGRLALGRNIFVAFLPFRGGNYEDSIVVSQRLIREDAFSSVHIEDFACDVRETKLGPEMTTCDIPNVSEEKLKDLDEEGVVRIGAEVGPNDILVGKISPKGEKALTAEERLLKAIFGEKAKDVKDTSLRMEHGKYGRVINVKVFSREKGDRLEPGVLKRIRVEVAQWRRVKVGDKLAGRHGNKGVVSMILPEEEMPFLEDGTTVDIVLNPLGVVSRMNIGQILETHLGWAAKKLGYLATTPSLLGAKEEDIKEELKKAGLPESGQVTLYDGQTCLPFPKKVTVGYMYMMKLIHMVEDKIHMRSIGPYSLITQQPLGGKAQFGGQRFGEMEVWALEAYGAAHILQEILTIKSDDVAGRAAAYESILKGLPVKKPNIPASFNLLVAELKSLGLNVEVKGLIRDEETEALENRLPIATEEEVE